MNREYYVYACIVKGNLVYVGKGKGNRYLHCTSGTSSCMELNRDLFKYGAHNFKVLKVVDLLTEQEALEMEKDVLMWDREGLSLYNRTYGANSKQDFNEQLALEFWYYLNKSVDPKFKWNGNSLFEEEKV
jgi:hypothetical protein